MKYSKTLGLTAVLTAVILMALAGVASADRFVSNGMTYTSTIKAVDEGSIEMHGPFTTISCSSSTIEAKVETHGFFDFEDTGGKINSWTFASCNYAITVLKTGTMQVEPTSGASGELISSGAEITAATSVANCIWTTSSTKLGNFIGSDVDNATIDFTNELKSKFPRTGHSFFCGSVGYLMGSYEVTTPATLSVD